MVIRLYGTSVHGNQCAAEESPAWSSLGLLLLELLELLPCWSCCSDCCSGCCCCCCCCCCQSSALSCAIRQRAAEGRHATCSAR
jgi:hypothetical protein